MVWDAWPSIRRDADRLAHISQGIFHHDSVLAFAENDANARMIFWVPHEVIDGRQVEVHFPREFWEKVGHFELNDDAAMQRQMIKQQIEPEVLPTNCQRIL